MREDTPLSRALVSEAERLIAGAKAKRLATLGPSIPKDWSQAVQAAYPEIWRYWPSVPAGWIDLVLGLTEHMRLSAPGAMIEDSKEKFGALRTQITGDEHMPDIAFDLSDIYEDLSTHICQDCGEPGRLRSDGGWDATLCDAHALKRDPQ